MIIRGYKPVENRTWKGKHRGELLIHAGKTFDEAGAIWILENFPLHKDAVEASEKLRGGIIGSVTMTDCVPRHPSPWFEGPWGFVFKNPSPMGFLPFRGQLMFFNVPDTFLRILKL